MFRQLTLSANLLLVVTLTSPGQEVRAKELYYAAVGGAAPKTSLGLKCWFEKMIAKDVWTRVRPDRPFYSGERIRVHIESNVSGRLTILQEQNDGLPEILFPDQRINEGDDRIEARADHPIAFRFDESPGKLHLILLLRPEDTLPGADTRALVSHAQQLARDKGLRIELDTSEAPALFAAAPLTAATARRGIATEIFLEHRKPPARR